MVDPKDVEGLIKGLMAEYDALVSQREVLRQQEATLKKQGEELDRKIAGLKKSLEGLSMYTTARMEPPALTKTHDPLKFLREMGSAGIAVPPDFTEPQILPRTLTECCRDILSRSGDWLTPLQVRQGLHAAGFDFSEYKSNPLSSIHTTLKRIAENEQAWSHTDSDNTYYRWRKNGEIKPAPPPRVIENKSAAPTTESKRKRTR